MKKIFVLLMVIVVGLGAYGIYRFFNRSVWDGENRINIVLRQSPTTVLTLSPQEKKMTLLTIPDGTYLETIMGYGYYKVESIGPLGELDGKANELLAGSVQEYLGIPINGFLKMNPCPQFEVREKRICLLNELWSSFLSNKDTNLTKWDRLRLWWGVRQMRLSKIQIIDLCQNQNCEKTTLPDGSEIWQLSPQEIDKITRGIFADPQINNEGFTVAILNGTPHSGLANRGARILTNIGYTVLKISDWDNKLSLCEVRSPKQLAGTYTLKKMMKTFDCRWQEDDLKGERVDMLLILGEYYWEKLSKKTEGF